MKPSEDVDQVLQHSALVVTLGAHDEPAREDLGVGDNVCGPVQRVAAVVDGAATLGLVVYGTEKLPFGGAHFGTRRGRARGIIEEKADDYAVALRDEKAAELV